MMSQRMPAKHDYSTWYLKHQAADAIGISAKQLDRWANEKRLHRVKWKRPGGGPLVNVYHPEDVERLAQSRQKTEAFVLSGDNPPVPNGARAVAVRQPSAEDFFQALASAVAGSIKTSETRLGPRLAERLYLTITEAAEFTGLGVGYLRRQISEGKLELVKGAGPRRADVVRRTELEKL